MKVAFTGHRPDKIGGYQASEIQDYVRQHIHNILLVFKETDKNLIVYSGMAQGVDTWAVEECIDQSIPFVAVLPCDGQEKEWPLAARDYYHRLLDKAQRIERVNIGPYVPWKMQARNERLVDVSDFLIAVWDGSSGGTYNCLEYAKSVKRTIVYIDLVKYKSMSK